MDHHQNHILTHCDNDLSFLHDQEFIEKSTTDVIPWFPQQEGFSGFDITQEKSELLFLLNVNCLLYLA